MHLAPSEAPHLNGVQYSPPCCHGTYCIKFWEVFGEANLKDTEMLNGENPYLLWFYLGCPQNTCKQWTIHFAFLYYTDAKMFILFYWAIYFMFVFLYFITSYCCCIVEWESASQHFIGQCISCVSCTYDECNLKIVRVFCRISYSRL